jgi:PDZ domain/PEGA domain
VQVFGSICRWTIATVCCFVLIERPFFAQQAGGVTAPDVLLEQAKTAFEALDYEQSVSLLDRLVNQLESGGPLGGLQRQQLIDTYELRGRSRFGLGDQDGVRSDFKKLLEIDPGHALSGQISPNVIKTFDDLKKTLVGILNFTVTPEDADVLLDGVLLPKTARGLSVLAGDHQVETRRLGYRSDSQSVPVHANAIVPLVVTLDRVSATMSIVTVPAGVEVLVDGISRGSTTAGPSPAGSDPPVVESPDAPVPGGSSPFVLGDISTGSHVIKLQKDCYVSSEQQLDVPQPHDYTLPLVRLEKAVGTLVIEGLPEARVLIDGASRGTTPLTVEDVCEGAHVVEVRSRYGRYGQRLDVRTGSRITVRGELRPAVAILSATGLEGLRGAPDLRARIQDAFQNVQSVIFLAPPADVMEQALAREHLDPGWMSFDSAHQPLGTASANITSAARQDLSSRLASALDVQAIAAVTAPTRDEPLNVLLTILAEASGDPDVIRVKLDDRESVRRASEQIDAQIPFFQPSIGLRLADVIDVGAVVVGVDPMGAAAASGISIDDTILRVNNEPLPDASHFKALLGNGSSDVRLTLEIRDRAGRSKQATLQTVRVPQAIAKDNQLILFNKLLIDLRNRLQRRSGEPDESVARLNLAIALMRIAAWADAKAELQKVRLPDGPGIANGTVQYLLGLCEEALGRREEADVAWRRAAATPALLTSDGPSIKDLAEGKLAEATRLRRQ